MIYKNSDFNANINNETVEVNKKTKTNFYTADKGTAQVRIYVTWNGKKLDLNKYNLTPQLDLFLEDGSIFLNEVITDVDEENGIIYYEVPSNIIVHVGKVDAKLFLKNDNQKVHVANFSFNILDSGVDDKVNKEISVNLVEDTVRNIIQEEVMDLLDADFKAEVFDGFQTYVNENVEQFKGPKGDTGDTGAKGDTGLKGDKGDTGAVGPQGSQGIRGPQGLKGDKGDKGEVGPMPDVSGFQKYKLTNDDGTIINLIDLDLNNVDHLNGGKYYLSSPINFPPLASSKHGVLDVVTREDGMFKKLFFYPYNSGEIWLKRFYNTWSEWERVDGINSIVVSSTQPSKAVVWFEVLD